MLRPFLALTVIVIGLMSLSYALYRGFRNDPVLRCSGLSVHEKKYCWDSTIRWITKHEGVVRALDAIQTWSTSQADIAENCHDLLHGIGQEAYVLYKKGRRIKLTQASQLCAHGFYHGIMENFIGKGEDIRGAGAFCQSVTANQKENQPALLGSCYHGIGHGAVLLHHKDAGQEPWKLINTGISLCGQATDAPVKLQNCVNGVIDGLASAFVSGEFPLSESIKADPLQICRKINQIHQAACYTGLDWLMLHIADNDLSKAAAFIEAIDQDEYAASSMHELSSLYVITVKDPTSVDSAVPACRALRERLRLPCVRGIVAGIFWHAGLPGREYEPALMFCQNKILLPTESDACFEELLEMAKIRYTKKQIKQICARWPAGYRTLCAQ